MIHNLWDAAKAVLRGKFNSNPILLPETRKKSQIHNLALYLKQLEKEEKIKPKERRKKEIIKIRAEINETEMKKIAKINETKAWFFEKLTKLLNL